MGQCAGMSPEDQRAHVTSATPTRRCRDGARKASGLSWKQRSRCPVTESRTAQNVGPANVSTCSSSRMRHDAGWTQTADTSRSAAACAFRFSWAALLHPNRGNPTATAVMRTRVASHFIGIPTLAYTRSVAWASVLSPEPVQPRNARSESYSVNSSLFGSRAHFTWLAYSRRR